LPDPSVKDDTGGVDADLCPWRVRYSISAEVLRLDTAAQIRDNADDSRDAAVRATRHTVPTVGQRSHRAIEEHERWAQCPRRTAAEDVHLERDATRAPDRTLFETVTSEARETRAAASCAGSG
jgi:hypothetical protein